MNDEILNEILENTKSVKKVVVDDVVEKQQKKKEQSSQRKAENKFKNVGAKFNEQEQDKIKTRLDDLSINQSQYIKKLIQDDLSTKNESCEEVIQINDLGTNNALNDNLEAISERVKLFNNLSMFEKIKYIILEKQI